MRIQNFKRIVLEDFQEKDRDSVGKLASSFNVFAEDVTNAFSKRLSITDNLDLISKDLIVIVDQAGIPITNIRLKSDLPSLCKGIEVIKATNDTNIMDISGTATAISAATLTQITTSSAHNLVNGDVITITGSDSTPSIDGKWQVAVKNTTMFYLPITVSGAGTTATYTKSFTPSGTPFITFSDNSGIITISKITNLEPNNQYTLRLVLYP